MNMYQIEVVVRADIGHAHQRAERLEMFHVQGDGEEQARRRVIAECLAMSMVVCSVFSVTKCEVE